MLEPRQVEQLLKPINPKRVLKDGKGHSHVSQQDIIAHLIRVFGFGSFDVDVLDATLVFEEPREKAGKYDVCYRALVRLTIKTPSGDVLATYENGSTATAQNQSRGDAHDLAYKSAISLSVKRCAINLGDQFGLSLYNKGQLDALVQGTLIAPAPEIAHGDGDVQENVQQQVTLGNDECDDEPAVPAALSELRAIRAELGISDDVYAESLEHRGVTCDTDLTPEDITEMTRVLKARRTQRSEA